MPDLESVIAANVRAERARRHWRQADLGQRLQWSVSQISDLETGRRAVHVNDLPRLCQALGVSLADLLARADPGDLAVLAVAGGPAGGG